MKNKIEKDKNNYFYFWIKKKVLNPMKSNVSKSLILGALILVLAPLIYLGITTFRLSNSNYLVSSIKEEKALTPSTYTYKTYTPEQVEKIIKPIEDQKKQTTAKERLLKDETRVVFFYLNKQSIEYFISAEVRDKESDSYCRLVVRSNFFLMTWLNKMNMLLDQNHKEHRIDKSICNALYGFGKPVL